MWLLGQIRNSTPRKEDLDILVALSSGLGALSPIAIQAMHFKNPLSYFNSFDVNKQVNIIIVLKRNSKNKNVKLKEKWKLHILKIDMIV